MKTFLVPTDYSEVAENATMYAVELAHKEKAKIILFHVFQIPYPVAPDSFVPIVSITELEKDAKEYMEKYKEKLLKKCNYDILIETKTTSGFITEALESFLKHHHVDLIVAGITGGGKMKEVLIGSNATSIVRNCKRDVLIIPADAKYKEIKKIGFATDFEFENENKTEHRLKHYATIFHAKIVAINISTDVDLRTPEKNAIIERTEKRFDEYDFMVKTIESNNVNEEIEKYVIEKKCDWLVIVPKHHNIFEKIFTKTHTKKLAYHVHVPVLAIHEE